MQVAAIPENFVVCPTPDGQFAEMVGPLYLQRDASGTSYGFRVEARHSNVRGNIHGGMLMTLADQILGLTVVETVGHLSPCRSCSSRVNLQAQSQHCEHLFAERIMRIPEPSGCKRQNLEPFRRLHDDRHKSHTRNLQA